MSDQVRHAIPSRLDDPERWLFWTLDEAAALLGPAVLGLAANAFVTGLLSGLAGWALLRRAKRGGGVGRVFAGHAPELLQEGAHQLRIAVVTSARRTRDAAGVTLYTGVSGKRP